ncbi:heptaprenyl diphosphate synthase component 1 [Cytobacillus oceanisediminis]|jgi:heptaprenyl diphosphate synthase|uniref:Heptaprenyl diphosphate synthase component 1 n=1 Tax=Niallia alba TaxID=2729105 RepID=A0A7Y0PNE1_9BACI|nr:MULTISPECIES: heptaprenyl diphosphate synthase component 1 [Bacillaceae]EOR23605.1 trans-hexaprenyltranstransferase [Niallia nealsonii AAU1]MBZ9533858.1 heptaprenyl diphosphate synthase component 1 [Cytobacillus oceanisediminis]NMO78256.1 heptaprenyl diphosphate synthase component 1 [Niallia alba]UTI41536.1 heptaprenyl diphosphate synthase component 1 [Niallia sp. RD1]
MAIQELLESVKRRVVEKTSNHYLQKHIPNPILDEHKLLLTISVLLQVKIKKQDIITYATTITLIQIALDTHELITNEKMHKGNERNRQLTVLAGDLYSGQYYKILAEIEDFRMLKFLAEGIKEVNENKIFFYHQNANSIEQLKESLKTIEGALIQKLVDYYQLDGWKLFVREFLFLSRIRKEKEEYNHTNSSIVVDAFCEYENKKLLPINSNKVAVLDKHIKETSFRLEELLENLPDLQAELRENVYQLLKVINKQQLYVEEG